MLSFRHNSLAKDGMHQGGNEHGGQTVIEAYWLERKKYLRKVKGIRALRWRFAREMAIYLLRRFLWSFGFFPVFIAFWVPWVLNRFNPVATVNNLLPYLQNYVAANPEQQAATVDTLLIAWASIGFIFAVFDFVLTPFKSPYEYEADIHMRAWEEMQRLVNPSAEDPASASHSDADAEHMPSTTEKTRLPDT